METRTSSVQQQRREETRRRLMDAGLVLFARKGYDGATLDEVAHAAGYSKGAVYVHFPSKEDLFLSILEERAPLLQQRLLNAVSRDGALVPRVQAALDVFLAECRQNPAWPGLLIEFWARAQRDSRVRQRLADMYASWRAFAADLLQRGIERGEIPPLAAPSATASTLIAIVDGLILQAQLDPQAVDIDALTGPISGLIARIVGRHEGSD